MQNKSVSGPVGNYYDKFGTSNPVAKYLMNGFISTFLSLYERVDAQRVLEIGCGEGHMLRYMQQTSPDILHGFDVEVAILQQAMQQVETTALCVMDAHHMAYGNAQFDLVVACEVLEHIHNPPQVLAEAVRVSRRYAIFSVPREPIWRMLNMARGKYWGELGNTPGHIQHWSTRQFVDLVEQHFTVLDVRTPLPWTMLLCEKK